MTVYRYDGSQKTPKNYVGVRVAVSVNGKLQQKWFPGITGECKEAEELERQWKFEQQLYKSKRMRERKEKAQNSAYITGVSGIKMKFVASIKRRNNNVYRYYAPMFIVSGSVDRQKFIKKYNIKTLGFDMAWFKACQYAAEKYGTNRLDYMLAKKPSVQQFHLIYRWQTGQGGHKIPEERLPNELLEG
jgi:hypothetical protein